MAGRSSDTLLRYDAAGWNFHGATNLDWLLSGVGHSSTRANAMSWLRENEITDVEALRELPGAAEQFITGLQLRPGALAEKIIRARLGAGRPADPASALTMQLIRQAGASRESWRDRRWNHTDPRMRPECVHFFGKANSWQDMRVVEDHVARRQTMWPMQLNNQSAVNCAPGVRYQIFPKRPGKGGWAVACDEVKMREGKLPLGSCSTLALLIPKCGSTNIRQVLRYWLKHYTYLRAREVPLREPAFNRLTGSFVMVRDPLSRLVSAYSTIADRASKMPASVVFRLYPFMRHADELARFTHFARLLRTEGDRLLWREEVEYKSCNREPIWMHAMSQMYFMQAYPYPFDHIVHLENFDADISKAEELFNLGSIFTDESKRNLRGSNKTTRANAKQGARALNTTQLMLAAPAAVADLLHYLRHDYACLTDYMPAG